MKLFFSDLFEMWREQFKFMKKHWIGTTILSIICGTVPFIPEIIEEIKYRKQLKLWKERNEAMTLERALRMRIAKADRDYQEQVEREKEKY